MHNSEITAVYINKENTHLFTASMSGNLKAWDIENFNELSKNESRFARNLHASSITDILIDDSNTFIITSSEDLKIKFWRLSDLELKQSIEDRSNFKSYEDELIKAQQHKIKYSEKNNIIPIFCFDNLHENNIQKMILVKDTLLTFGSDEAFYGISISKLKNDLLPPHVLTLKKVCKPKITGIYINLRKKRNQDEKNYELAITNMNFTIKIFRCNRDLAGACEYYKHDYCHLHMRGIHQDLITKIIITDDDNYITASRDNTIKIHHVSEEYKPLGYKLLWKFDNVHNSVVNDIVSYTKNGSTYILSGGDDDLIKIHNITNINDASKMKYVCDHCWSYVNYYTHSLSISSRDILFVGGTRDLTLLNLNTYFTENIYEDQNIHCYEQLTDSSIIMTKLHNSEEYLFVGSKDGKVLVMYVGDWDNLNETPYFQFSPWYKTSALKIYIDQQDKNLIILTDNDLILIYNISDINNLKDSPMRIIDKLHEDYEQLGFAYNSFTYEFWGFDEEQNIKLADFGQVADRFISQNQIFKTNFRDFLNWDTLLYEKIQFFNTKMEMNQFSYVLATELFFFSFQFKRHFIASKSKDNDRKIDTKFELLKNHIVDKREQILSAYAKVERVSMLDIKIFTIILKAFDLPTHIETFISTIIRSKHCEIPSHEEIFKWLVLLFNQKADVVIPFPNEEIGKPLTQSFVETLFKKVDNFDFGSRELVNKGIISSYIAPSHIECKKKTDEVIDEFKLENTGCNNSNRRQNIEIDVYTMKYRMDIENPKIEDLIFMRAIKFYCSEENDEMLETKPFYNFIASTWQRLKENGVVYLWVGNLQVFLMFSALGFTLKEDDTASNILGILIIFLKFCYFFFEDMYFFTGQWSLLKQPEYIDITTRITTILAIIIMFFHEKESTRCQSIYIVAFVLCFIKFYFDLRYLDSFRNLSYAITKICIDNANFFCLMLLFIMVFAQMFYAPEFWNAHSIYPEDQTRNYFWYMYWCWEYVFGNYEYGTPKDDKFYWVTSVSVIYSFFFTYLLSNTLVALVQASYGAVNDAYDIWNTRIKISMISEGLDFFYMYNNQRLVKCCTRKNVNSKKCCLTSKKYVYLIIPRSSEVKSNTNLKDSICKFKAKSENISEEISRSYKLLKTYMYKEENLLDDKLMSINKTVMNLEVYSESISQIKGINEDFKDQISKYAKGQAVLQAKTELEYQNYSKFKNKYERFQKEIAMLEEAKSNLKKSQKNNQVTSEEFQISLRKMEKQRVKFKNSSDNYSHKMMDSESKIEELKTNLLEAKYE